VPVSIGLGCLRLPQGDGAALVLEAAIRAGAAWLDTARAYRNEELVGRYARNGVRIITKCGMTRDGERWIPDGRAGSILNDARASMAALGRAPDVLLLHAVDPKVPLSTSMRALDRARREGLARAIGVCNVTRRQLEEIEVPIAFVQVAVGAYDDEAARGGVLAWCKERQIPVFAHAPFGGPKRAHRLGKDGVLKAIAARRGASPWTVMLAYLRALGVIPIPGTSKVDHAAALHAAPTLDVDDLRELDARLPGLLRSPPRPPTTPRAEVVMVMGLPGAGKSRFVTNGLEGVRLNRDMLGGTLRGIAQRLGETLSGGSRRVLLDNTYLSRASRADVLRVAHAHGAAVRCVHLTIDPAAARVNLVLRMLDKHGALLGGPALAAAARRDANTFLPGSFSRMERQLELPSMDEGFASIEERPFVRDPGSGVGAVLVPLDVFERDPDVVASDSRRVLVYGWVPGASEDAIRARVRAGAVREVDSLICPHPAGPAVCWCRPPLPGLWALFARAAGVDARASELVARTPGHEAMARAIGVAIRALPEDFA
jgi:diketogulonate reductase-like aldo/keto reductase